MKLVILIIFQIASTGLLFCQKKYKWPYFGENIPPYIGITGGYEGMNTNNFLVGLVLNARNLVVTPPVGAMVGGGLFYKQSTTSPNIYSFESEIGMYGGVVLGLNYSYNITTSNQLSGLKPFAGIAIFNAQLFYGYCFYKSDDDLNTELRHHRITFRYVFPIIRLKTKSKVNNG